MTNPFIILNIVSLVSSETGRSIESIAEAFLASHAYTLLSDKRTGYYWDSIGELVEKFKEELGSQSIPSQN